MKIKKPASDLVIIDKALNYELDINATNNNIIKYHDNRKSFHMENN